MRVVVTGATGFIGSALVPALRARGDEIVVLSRDAATARARLGAGDEAPRTRDMPSRAKAALGEIEAVTAELETRGPWAAALAGADAIVHLAGAPIAGKRWDAREKQVIRDSRVESTRVIVEALEALATDKRPRALISASGTDYYPFALGGDFDDDDVTESDPPSDSYLGRLCRDWEAEAVAAERLGVRVVRMRTGLVLGPGGALGRMTAPFKLFVGGRIGRGDQWVSWIHRDDAVAAYVEAVHDERYRGPINLVTDSVRNRELASAIGKALGRPSWLPVPALAIKAAVGELAAYLLHGRRVVPARLRELGFAWRHPALGAAVSDALARANAA